MPAHTRREEDLPLGWRFIHFWLAFLVDGWHGISLTRIMALYIMYKTMQVTSYAHRISGNDVIVIIACLAAAFGKGVFQLFLIKAWRGKSESTDKTENVKIDQAITMEVNKRREAGAEFGIEAAP